MYYQQVLDLLQNNEDSDQTVHKNRVASTYMLCQHLTSTCRFTLSYILFPYTYNKEMPFYKALVMGYVRTTLNSKESLFLLTLCGSLFNFTVIKYNSNCSTEFKQACTNRSSIMIFTPSCSDGEWHISTIMLRCTVTQTFFPPFLQKGNNFGDFYLLP